MNAKLESAKSVLVCLLRLQKNILILFLTLSIIACEKEAEDYTGTKSKDDLLVGSWELPGGFDSLDPSMISFFDNGNYIVYTDCSLGSDTIPNVDLEIGTYTATNKRLTITSHIQNGCGGFDHENDALSIPDSPFNLSFNGDGSAVTFNDINLTLTRIQNDDKLIVGSWTMPTGFQPADPLIINFYNNGLYAVYSRCTGADSVNLEIGTYSATTDFLVITSHIQNGCGGFDDEDDPTNIPDEPLVITFNHDGSALILDDPDIVLRRVGK